MVKTQPLRRTGGVLAAGRMLYVMLASSIVLLIIAQVVLVGLNVFLSPRYWGTHIGLGHAIGGMLVALLPFGIAARVRRSAVLVNVGLVFLFALQYNHRTLAALTGIPELAAIHAANALMLFAGATWLVGQGWQALRS